MGFGGLGLFVAELGSLNINLLSFVLTRALQFVQRPLYHWRSQVIKYGAAHAYIPEFPRCWVQGLRV